MMFLMLMAPVPISLLLGATVPVEFPIFPVLLGKILVVSAVFISVPIVIILVFAIVVTPLLLLLLVMLLLSLLFGGGQDGWRNKGGGEKERAGESESCMHVFSLGRRWGACGAALTLRSSSFWRMFNTAHPVGDLESFEWQ
jgi:hypothetical protein